MRNRGSIWIVCPATSSRWANCWAAIHKTIIAAGYSVQSYMAASPVGEEVIPPQIVGAVIQCSWDPAYEALVRKGIPAVCLCGTPGHPGASMDDALIGKMAADHFFQRGIRRFACRSNCGQYDLRTKAFRMRNAERGYETLELWSTGDLNSILLAAVGSGPGPLGVFTRNDNNAMAVMNRVASLGIRIPDDIALIGVDNNQIAEAMSITSISLDAKRQGLLAAQMLLSMLQGKNLDPNPVLIPPLRLIVRKSTDVLGYSDPIVRKAILCMREHVHEEIDLGTISRLQGIGRRRLEQKFLEIVNRSPGEVFTEIRLDHAKNLLDNTNLTLQDVARKIGFRSATALVRLFQRSEGCTPGAWRLKSRGRL